jgi:pimeloyl-ACP methyl ester carboxylesterase
MSQSSQTEDDDDEHKQNHHHHHVHHVHHHVDHVDNVDHQDGGGGGEGEWSEKERKRTRMSFAPRLHIKEWYGIIVVWMCVIAMVVAAIVLFPLTIVLAVVFVFDRIRLWQEALRSPVLRQPIFSWEPDVVQRNVRMRDGTTLVVDCLGFDSESFSTSTSSSSTLSFSTKTSKTTTTTTAGRREDKNESESEGESKKTKKKVVVLVHGVGGDRFSYEKIIERFYADGYAVMCWDFRGLFRSSTPELAGRFAVRDQAEDLHEIMLALGIDKAEVMVGWSTGVQIGLEFAGIYPEMVEHLVIANGTHGQALHAGFPIRLPFLDQILHAVLSTMIYLNQTAVFYEMFVSMYKLCKPVFYLGYVLYASAFGNPMLVYHFDRYNDGVFLSGREHQLNYLQYFQMLDAHSIIHVLSRMKVHTLCVSGFFDVLTPQYAMFEISSRMPNCEHVAFLTATHFVPLEFGDVIVEEILRFIAKPQLS